MRPEGEEMRRIVNSRPSPVIVIAILALVAAVAGTAVAADPVATTSVSKKKVKKIARKQAEKFFNANIGKASVAHAATADSANTANTANTANAANAAFSTFHDGGIDMPSSVGTIGTLNIPKAGSYVINAKLWALDVSATNATSGECTLSAGADSDTTKFDALGNSTDDTESVALQLVHTFSAPGSVVLACTDNGIGDMQAFDTKITAVQVAELTNTGF
jgi:hypothetical protein